MRFPEILHVPDVAIAGADLVATEMVRAAGRGRFVLNLSGGSTPLAMFELLAARRELPWESTWVVWGDERFVPPEHASSNQRAARKALLGRVPIPEEHILPWPYDELGPEAVADRYGQELSSAFAPPPMFDLTLLGLGADAHTASLFPGTEAVRATGVTTVVRPPGDEMVRVSMTAATLSSSRTVAFLVSGEAKRAALEATLAGVGDHDRFPARAISAHERLVWLTDLMIDL